MVHKEFRFESAANLADAVHSWSELSLRNIVVDTLTCQLFMEEACRGRLLLEVLRRIRLILRRLYTEAVSDSYPT